MRSFILGLVLLVTSAGAVNAGYIPRNLTRATVAVPVRVVRGTARVTRRALSAVTHPFRTVHRVGHRLRCHRHR